MPNFVLEAMAAGIPLASTRAGAAPELLEEGALGRLAPVGDHAALAEAILAQLADPATARAMAARAAAKAHALTAENIAGAYLALFDAAS
jgi:glycosyltransferase involved in cell wall biosynthesis